MATVENIKKTVRRLTKRPSIAQITEAELLEYINNYYLYDFPQEVQTSDLVNFINFTTTPNVDVYSSTTGNFTDNLKDMIDQLVEIEGPVYVAGRRIYLSTSPQEFNELYSPIKYQDNLGSGDNVTVGFNFTLSTKIVPNTLVLSSLLTNNEAITVTDTPNTDTYERITVDGILYDQAGNNVGTINYLTGALAVTFVAAPGDGKTISYEAQIYEAGQPDAMLYYNNSFTLRPIPNKVYEVNFQARSMPTAFTLDTESPVVKQWWQLIAYGAAKKILEDLGDMEAVQRIMPEYVNQLEFVNAKTNIQNEKKKTSTIYDEGNKPSMPWPWSWY